MVAQSCEGRSRGSGEKECHRAVSVIASPGLHFLMPTRRFVCHRRYRKQELKRLATVQASLFPQRKFFKVLREYADDRIKVCLRQWHSVTCVCRGEWRREPARQLSSRRGLDCTLPHWSVGAYHRLRFLKNIKNLRRLQREKQQAFGK